MYSLAEFGKSIADIQMHNKSGVLILGGQDAATGAPTQIYSLRFEHGELSRVSGGGNLTVKEVLQILMGLSQWVLPRWFPLNPSAAWNTTPQMERQELASLLNVTPAVLSTTVRSAEKTVSPDSSRKSKRAAEPSTGTELLKRVINVFMSVYPGDTLADLGRIAKRHPPGSEPQVFIEACIRLLEPMLGEKAAREMLLR